MIVGGAARERQQSLEPFLRIGRTFGEPLRLRISSRAQGWPPLRSQLARSSAAGIARVRSDEGEPLGGIGRPRLQRQPRFVREGGAAKTRRASVGALRCQLPSNASLRASWSARLSAPPTGHSTRSSSGGASRAGPGESRRASCLPRSSGGEQCECIPRMPAASAPGSAEEGNHSWEGARRHWFLRRSPHRRLAGPEAVAHQEGGVRGERQIVGLPEAVPAGDRGGDRRRRGGIARSG